MRSPLFWLPFVCFHFCCLNLSILLLCALIKCKFVSHLSMWINFYPFHWELTLMNSFLCWIRIYVCWYKSILSNFNIWSNARKFVIFFAQKNRICINKRSMNLTWREVGKQQKYEKKRKHFFFICVRLF